MTTQRALSADTARKTALDDCENKIKSAFRRGLQATCEIAKELYKIQKNELFTIYYATFAEYVTRRLQISERSYHRIISVSHVVAQLQEAGLALPANQAQAEELSRLEAPLRPKLWNDLLTRFEHEESALTADDIKKAVDAAVSELPAAKPVANIEVEMEESDNGSEPPAAETKEAELILTEKGEAALNRIRKICGDMIANAILDGTRAMTEREIKLWADLEDDMMKQLLFFVVDQKYTLSKAVTFINREISDSTDVHDLILIASARGGSATINHKRARIKVEWK
jgi:hypothetical protein